MWKLLKQALSCLTIIIYRSRLHFNLRLLPMHAKEQSKHEYNKDRNLIQK